MTALSLLASAIAPGVALLSYFYLKDRYEAEPIASVAKMFALGFLTVFPTMVIQRGFVLGLGDHPLLFAFGISAGIEEFIKWFLVFYLVYRNTLITAPYDGIVYATAVSLGFATMENVMFSLLYRPSFQDLLYRALLPVSGHALFGVLMGFHFGKAKFKPGLVRRHLVLSYVQPVLWHGAFDFIMLRMSSYWLLAMVPFMIALWARSLRKMNRANRMPFMPVPGDKKIKISANGQ
jgi:RsiW-degrading membrane proteinase PrsW (M82 family)